MNRLESSGGMRTPSALWHSQAALNRLSLTYICLALCILVTGCSRGPQISISWKSAKPGLEKGVPLRYESIEIGQAVQVISSPEGTTARARLEKKYAHYVRTKSTFMFHQASAGNSAFVEVIALDKDAPTAPAGAHFSGSDSAVEVGFKMITTDWTRTALYCAVGLGLVLLFLWAARVFLRLWAVIATKIGRASCRERV